MYNPTTYVLAALLCLCAGCGDNGAMPLTQECIKELDKNAEKARADVMINVNQAEVRNLPEKEHKLRVIRIAYDVQAKVYENSGYDYHKTLDACTEEFIKQKNGQADAVRYIVAQGIAQSMMTIIKELPHKKDAPQKEGAVDISEQADTSSLPPEFIQCANRLIAAITR